MLNEVKIWKSVTYKHTFLLGFGIGLGNSLFMLIIFSIWQLLF